MIAPVTAKTKPRPPTSTARPKRKRAPSAYAKAGDDARRAAQRELLLSTLKAHDWNLRASAVDLGLTGTPGVVRALLDVAADEYAAAKADGRIRPGVRR